jgi:hypothetical protein
MRNTTVERSEGEAITRSAATNTILHRAQGSGRHQNWTEKARGGHVSIRPHSLVCTWAGGLAATRSLSSGSDEMPRALLSQRKGEIRK